MNVIRLIILKTMELASMIHYEHKGDGSISQMRWLNNRLGLKSKEDK